MNFLQYLFETHKNNKQHKTETLSLFMSFRREILHSGLREKWVSFTKYVFFYLFILSNHGKYHVPLVESVGPPCTRTILKSLWRSTLRQPVLDIRLTVPLRISGKHKNHSVERFELQIIRPVSITFGETYKIHYTAVLIIPTWAKKKKKHYRRILYRAPVKV